MATLITIVSLLLFILGAYLVLRAGKIPPSKKRDRRMAVAYGIVSISFMTLVVSVIYVADELLG